MDVSTNEPRQTLPDLYDSPLWLSADAAAEECLLMSVPEFSWSAATSPDPFTPNTADLDCSVGSPGSPFWLDSPSHVLPLSPSSSKSSTPEIGEEKQQQQPRQRNKAGGHHTVGPRNTEFVEDDRRRRQSFSKRKKGLVSKMEAMHKKTKREGFVLLVSETGRLYFEGTPGMRGLLSERDVNKELGKCLKDMTNVRPLRRSPSQLASTHQC